MRARALHTVAGRLIATGVAFELLEPEDAAAELEAIAHRFAECLRPEG